MAASAASARKLVLQLGCARLLGNRHPLRRRNYSSTARECLAQCGGYEIRCYVVPLGGMLSEVAYCNSDKLLPGHV